MNPSGLNTPIALTTTVLAFTFALDGRGKRYKQYFPWIPDSFESDSHSRVKRRVLVVTANAHVISSKI
jgi:hypothetical protein